MKTTNVTEMKDGTKLPVKLFVYGTLMKGFGNYAGLLKGQKGVKFLGKAKTVESYEMRTVGFPFVNPNVTGSTILGEVFEISNPRVLQRVDQLEGHPTWYMRTPIQVVMDETGEELTASIYFNQNPDNRGDIIENGDYRAWAKSVGRAPRTLD